MRSKLSAIVFILVFLLAGAVLVSMLTADDDKEPEIVTETSAPQTPTDVPTAAPTQAPTPLVTNTPAPTPAPTPTPTPVPTPTPTPEPTPTPIPIPAGVTIGSGSFASETGTGLNVLADWTAVAVDDTHVDVTVTVSLRSYSLQLKEVYNAVNISLAGQYASMNAPAINYAGNDAITTVLAVKTFTIELAAGAADTFPLAVEYHYGGTYSKTELPVIECGGSVTLSR